MTAILTSKLNSGVVVLAKSTPTGVFAKTFANKTQAARAAEKVGGEVIQPRLGPVFYVMMPE